MRIVLLFFTALFALPLAAQETGAAQQLRKLMQVYRYLDGLYVDEVEMGPLVESAIEGMLEELDPPFGLYRRGGYEGRAGEFRR